MTGVARHRILYVHHRPELGGAPSSLSYLLRMLDRERFEPHVFCPPGPVVPLFESVGAEVHLGPVAAFTHIWASTYRGRRWVLLANEMRKLPAHTRRFRATLRSLEFSLVHLNDSPLVPAAWLARRNGLPVVWHLRSSLPDRHDLRSRFLQGAVRSLSTASIAITRDVGASFAVGAEIIPNSVDLEQFRPGDPIAARATLGLPVDRPLVTFIGFLYPSKGFQDFIMAASLLTRLGVDATFLIVGGPVRGPEFFATPVGRIAGAMGLAHDFEEEATALTRELNLVDRVRFVPFTREPSMLYQASDIVVAPSRGPELGRPLIEAAACGRAVIASGSLDGGGILLPSQTGELVPRRSPDALADALARLLHDRPLRDQMGHAARVHAEASFDPRINAERVMAIYNRLVAA